MPCPREPLYTTTSRHCLLGTRARCKHGVLAGCSLELWWSSSSSLHPSAGASPSVRHDHPRASKDMSTYMCA
ncbi:hypothetical protein SORBI_3010G133866 [Sorghum bicolor]|uniref:Uncharacterized protein n=1 Tax=Sorghum bicolor TaxID=4558 RepID=A0A1W0VST6_SORBI|nr:hypothetical protein SORBI_3010G133866 [Sorghum bicolor]